MAPRRETNEGCDDVVPLGRANGGFAAAGAWGAGSSAAARSEEVMSRMTSIAAASIASGDMAG